MARLSLVLVCAGLALAPAGCKIVKDAPEGETGIASGAAGDDARTAQRLDTTFDAELVPFVTSNAQSVADLRAALAGGLDQAGAAAKANRGAGAGAAWNFAVKGQGKVVAAALDTRARTAALDTDGDGTADVTLQLGPVIKGTALRDAAPFYNFDDFRDQIEFAKLARALNDRIAGMVTLPDGDLVGRTLAFTGVVALKAADEPLVVTPIAVEVAP